MILITSEIRARLLANGETSRADPSHDPRPVVKLFTPDAGATWLLSELDPDDPDIAFGLCDLGLGFTELGSVSIGEIEAIRGHLGLPVERDVCLTLTEACPLMRATPASRDASLPEGIGPRSCRSRPGYPIAGAAAANRSS